MLRIAKDEKGSLGSLGTLIALAVLAVLVASYMRDQGIGTARQSSAPTNAVARSQGVACQAQRTQLDRDLIIWGNDHPDQEPSIGALSASGVRVPSCPEGGEYYVSGRHVHCSKHP